jgi:hypothetical protein
MSRRTDVALRVLVLVVATAFLVLRLVQRDWLWAGLWAVGVAVVAFELVRRVRERPADSTTGRSAR